MYVSEMRLHPQLLQELMLARDHERARAIVDRLKAASSLRDSAYKVAASRGAPKLVMDIQREGNRLASQALEHVLAQGWKDLVGPPYLFQHVHWRWPQGATHYCAQPCPKMRIAP